MKKEAIIICDFQNEIIHPAGKFKAKGYATFVEQNNVLSNTNLALEKARENDMTIIFVRVGFSTDYKEQPKNSLLFSKADQLQALKLGTWATQIHEELKVKEDDFIVTKHRVSPYYATKLDLILRNKRITDVYLCGCATDMVVSSAVRESHDRDLNIFVLGDCCAAASIDDHQNALTTIKKFATVGDVLELL